MYTECPECQTYFKITPDQLKAAEGKVRCGNCSHVFNALTNLAEKVPAKTNSDSETSSDSIIQTSGQIDNDIIESNISFQVSEPESEAALSQFSLPSTAESIDVSARDELAKATEQNAKNIAAEVKSTVEAEAPETEDFPQPATSLPKSSSENISIATSELSDMDLSALASQMDELPKNAEPSSIKTNLSSFSELNSKPVGNIAEEPQSSVIAKAIVDQFSDASVAVASESVSYADVEVPGVGSNEEKTEPSLEDINKDINNALDNLFDEEPVAKRPESKVDSLLIDPPISGINNLSEIENYQKKEKVSAVVDLDLSDSGSKAPTQKQKSVEKELDVDLDDSFLSGEPLKSEAVDWEPYDHSGSQSENYSGDNFKLEELAESDTASSGGGASRIMWIVVIAALLVILLGQFMYLKREELAKYPAARPVLEFSCAMLNIVVTCEVPDPRDIEAIVILERNVVSHPNAKNALLITSIINNEAEFDQKFPELVLTFSDINQKVLARRIFKPDEYLAKGVDIPSGMASKEPVKIMLEIVDPGEAAVNFKFDFQ